METTGRARAGHDGKGLMRLVCPRCGAQYEIDDEAIPPQGRDVECSSCDNVWRATRPFDPGARPVLSRPLNDSVLEILRQEAARELEARAAERAAERAVERTAVALAQFQRPRTDGGPDTPAPDDEGGAAGTPTRVAPGDFSVADGMQSEDSDGAVGSPVPQTARNSAPAGVLRATDSPPAAARDEALSGGAEDAIPRRRNPPAAGRPASPPVAASPADSPGGARRDLHAGTADLPDDPGGVTPSADRSLPPPQRAALPRTAPDPVGAAVPYPAAHPAPPASARSRARARRDAGFHVAVVAAVVAVALYALAPRLAEQGPLGAQLLDWHAQVNTGRDWLAAQADRLIGNGTTTAEPAAE